MVLKLEQILGSKNSIHVIRHLILKPYLSFGLTELSEILNISKSNILRIMKPLIQSNIVRTINKDRKKKYRINYTHEITKYFYSIFMLERQSNLKPETKNTLDLIFERLKAKVDTFIVFGSTAYGLETKGSDIDILVTGPKDISGLRFENEKKVEVHYYPDLKNISDFVILEAIINGICYKGEVFEILAGLKFIPKSYMISRLKNAEEFLNKSKKLQGEAGDHFKGLAKIALGQIDSILTTGSPVPRAKIYLEPSDKLIKDIEEILSKEGKKIWIN